MVPWKKASRTMIPRVATWKRRNSTVDGYNGAALSQHGATKCLFSQHGAMEESQQNKDPKSGDLEKKKQYCRQL
jgi:hypothetical protein